MQYVIAIYNGAMHEGYVHVPPRSAKVRVFRTLDIKQAQRFGSKDKAMNRAGRFNDLHRDDGQRAMVVPYREEEAE